MIHCFEYWYGPTLFYEDSYKLVEAPHPGYGTPKMLLPTVNGFVNGYKDTIFPAQAGAKMGLYYRS